MPSRQKRSPAQQRATLRMLQANRQRRGRAGVGSRQRRSPRRTRAQPQPHARARGHRRAIRVSPQQVRAYRRGERIRPAMAEWDRPIAW